MDRPRDRRGALPVVLLSMLVAAEARAEVYEQMHGPNSTGIWVSSVINSSGNPPGFRVADDFLLPNDTVITEAQWWGTESLAGMGMDFQFTFYADEAGTPGAVLHTSGGTLETEFVSVGSRFLDPVVFHTSILDAPFSAAADTTYWFSVFNQSKNTLWLWLRADDPGNGAWQGEVPVPPWESIPADMAFRLIPAPATVWLGVGLAMIGMRVRTRSPACAA